MPGQRSYSMWFMLTPRASVLVSVAMLLSERKLVRAGIPLVRLSLMVPIMAVLAGLQGYLMFMPVRKWWCALLQFVLNVVELHLGSYMLCLQWVQF